MNTRQGQINGPSPRCPKCAKILDGWSSVGHENMPKDGDVTLCAYCRTLLTFRITNGVASFQYLLPSEFEALPRSTRMELRRAQHAIEQLRTQYLEKRN